MGHRRAQQAVTRDRSCASRRRTGHDAPAVAHGHSDHGYRKACLGVGPWLRLLDGISPQPLVVDLFPTGADRPDLWPWSIAPELTGAVTGMAALTGYEFGPPVQPEMPLAEYLAGALAAAGAMAELRKASPGQSPARSFSGRDTRGRAARDRMAGACCGGARASRTQDRQPVSAQRRRFQHAPHQRRQVRCAVGGDARASQAGCWS